MFRTIRSALYAAFIGLVVFILLLLALLATPRIKETAVNQISQELFKQMALVKDHYQELLVRRASPEVLQAEAERSFDLSGSRVTVIKENGEVLADSATPFLKLEELESHADREEILQAEKKGKGMAARYSPTLGKELIYAAVPIRDAGKKIVAFLRFAVPETYATDLVKRINVYLGAALVIAVVVALILGIAFSHSFVSPMRRLTAVAHKIAGGEVPQTIVMKSRFEIGALEDAIEQMSWRLAEAFRELETEQKRVFAILSSMAEGVLAVNQEGKIIYANPVIEKMFGVIEPEVKDRTVREGLRNNEVADLIEETRREGKSAQREIEILMPQEITVVAHASSILTREGEVIGVVCILYDVTQIKKLERYRSEFVANVSHELKTPLTSIRNYVETLLTGGMEDRKNNIEFLRKIDKHALNLSNLIDDIIEISRLETKKGLGPFVEIDVNRILRHAVDTIAGKAKKKKIDLELECGSGEYFILGIEDHVYRAVLNLLDNAVNYTDPGGKVLLACTEKDGHIEIRVSDTGIGIPDEHLARIFERFYRVDKGRSRELGGTGLGLSIVKHVMNIHNGSVSVKSEIGKGSVFTLVFPS